MFPELVMLSRNVDFKAPVRNETLRQLDAMGFHVHLYMDDYPHPSPANVLRHAWKAITPHYSWRDGVLFLEDDLDFNRATFGLWLQHCIDLDQIASLCILRHSLYGPGVTQNASEYVARWVPLQNYDARYGFHGSMAVYLPQRVVKDMAARREEFMQPDGSPLEPGTAHGFDFWVKNNARRFGGLYGALPNPVNHRPGPTSWSRPGQNREGKHQDFQSTTYRGKVKKWAI